MFLITSLMMVFTCLAASFARTFYQLLVCVSLLGLAGGFPLIVVSTSFVMDHGMKLISIGVSHRH